MAHPLCTLRTFVLHCGANRNDLPGKHKSLNTVPDVRR